MFIDSEILCLFLISFVSNNVYLMHQIKDSILIHNEIPAVSLISITPFIITLLFDTLFL